MCVKPKIINGHQVECKFCDKCIAKYKTTWVNRCLAERATSKFAYAVTFTYAPTEEGDPLGARIFHYPDMQRFLKRLRKEAWTLTGDNIDLRYIIVGETGTLKNRCHFHAVLFTDVPLDKLGTYEGAKTKGFGLKRRLNWSLWPEGFTYFEPADKKGIAYTIKYVLKSKMNAQKSKGHAREGKTEWLAHSSLWCSKRPAIGHDWLWDTLENMRAVGTCPHKLALRVPGGGDWYISDPTLQKKVCLWLHAANLEFRDRRGRNLAGWNTLLRSFKEYENLETGELAYPKAKGWLENGEEIEGQVSKAYSKAQWEKYQAEYTRKKRIAAPITNGRAVVRQCGNVLPCEKCKRSLPDRHLANIEQEYELWFEEWQHRNPQGPKVSDVRYREAFEGWWRTRLRPSRGCQLRDTPELREAFDRLRPLERANPETRHRKGIAPSLQGTAKGQTQDR